MILRDYQRDAEAAAYAAWQDGAQNIMVVLPTGAGKTVLFSKIMRDEPGASIAIAHRHELVSQISLALARNEVRHRIIGTPALKRDCVRLHMLETGKNYVDGNAARAVAGVDTLIRMPADDPFFRAVKLWVCDEAHHQVTRTKWGKVTLMFPQARGLGVTATPVRADGLGLGRHADGLTDKLIVGVGMRDLITRESLTDYRIFAPPSDLDLSGVAVSAGGDFSPPGLSNAVHKSHITGDVVAHYQRIAPGKLGVTFAVDVEAAGEICQAFNAAGIPAAMVTAGTNALARAAILREFRARRILQLVNVDLFGEGFDLPALEVVSMARPTASYALFAQQFGRALRPAEGKTHAIIIDHVGNVMRHGLPDRPRNWSLDRRERRGKGQAPDVIPLRACPKCMGAYERIHRGCPYCGHVPEPAGRSTPEQVDGDLLELSPEALARLRGAVDAPVSFPYGATAAIVGALKKHHAEKAEAQALLRDAMMLWGGARRAEGLDLSQSQRLFFHKFGIDVLSAQALGRSDAEELRGRVTGVSGKVPGKCEICGMYRDSRRRIIESISHHCCVR